MKILEKTSKILLYFAAALLAVTAILAVRSSYGYANKLYLVALGIITMYGLYRIFIPTDKEKTDVIQLVIILITLALFLDTSLIHNTSSKVNYKYFTACFMAIHTNLIWCIKLLIKKSDGLHLFRIIKDNYAISIVILIFSILGVLQLRANHVWDAVHYENAISNMKNIEYTTKSIQFFNLCGHASWSYGLITAIGEYILPIDGIGIRFIQIIMADITIVLVYRLIRIICNVSRNRSALFSAVFAASPMVLGMVHYISPDFGLLCFVVWMIYCNIKEYKYLRFATMFLVCFSKEPGIIICFAYYLMHFLVKAICAPKGERIKTFFFEKSFGKFVTISAFPLLFIANIMLGHNSAWKPGANDVHAQAGITLEHVIMKCKTILIANFNWLFVLVGIICIVYAVIKRKKYSPQLWVLIGMTFIYSVFQLVYITYNHFRYVQVYAFLIVIIMAIAMQMIPRLLSAIMSSIFVVISLISCIKVIDPVTVKAFPTQKAASDTFITSRLPYENDEYNFSDSSVYSYQYQEYFMCLNKILDEIDYDGTQTIVMPALSMEHGTHNNYLEVGQNANNYEFYYVPALKKICTVNAGSSYERNYMKQKGYRLEVKFVKDIDKFNETVNENDKVYFIDPGIEREGMITIDDVKSDKILSVNSLFSVMKYINVKNC